MSQIELDECLKMLRVFADEKRLSILSTIGSKRLSGVDILKKIDIPQPTLSYHLKVLCENGILNAENEWRWTYYTINNDGIEKAIKLLKQFEVGK